VQLLWTLCDEQWDDATLAAVRARVPEHMCARMPNYRRWQDVQMGLSGKLLLLQCLRRAGITTAIVERMTWSATGRPDLPIEGDFNVSHSGGLVVCAYTPRGRLGVDVEKIHHVPLEELADALSDPERASIEAMQDQDTEFFRVWTFKEAVIKADGRGVGLGLKRIDSRAQRVDLDGDVWQVVPVALHPDYWCHVACDRPVTDPAPACLSTALLLA